MLRPTSEPKRPEPPESPTCQLGAKTVIKAWLCPLSETPPRSAAEDICTDEGLPFLLMTLPALKLIEPFILIITMPSTNASLPPWSPTWSTQPQNIYFRIQRLKLRIAGDENSFVLFS